MFASHFQQEVVVSNRSSFQLLKLVGNYTTYVLSADILRESIASVTNDLVFPLKNGHEKHYMLQLIGSLPPELTIVIALRLRMRMFNMMCAAYCQPRPLLNFHDILNEIFYKLMHIGLHRYAHTVNVQV